MGEVISLDHQGRKVANLSFPLYSTAMIAVALVLSAGSTFEVKERLICTSLSRNAGLLAGALRSIHDDIPFGTEIRKLKWVSG